MLRLHALVLALAFSPTARAADATIRTYEVSGNTFRELLRSMRENGPFVERTGQRHYGVTETEFRQEWDYQRANGRCELLAARTELDLTIVLPEWADREGASPPTIRRWDRLRGDIERHEEQHAAIARDFLRKLEAETDRPVSAPTCAALEAGLKARSEAIMKRHRDAQAELDAGRGTPLRNPRAG